MNPLRISKLSCTSTILLITLVSCSDQSSLSELKSPADSPFPTASVVPSSGTIAKPSAATQKSQVTQDLENKLRADVSQRAGINIRAVSCPNTVGTDSTRPFDCQATAEGKTFTLSIRLPSNKQELQWNTKGLLVLPKLEQTIQQGIKEQFQLDIKANCGGKIRISKPGDTFECKVTDERGQKKAITVRVDDERGNVTWKL